MTPETADELLNVLTTLIDGYNDLTVKVIAAERERSFYRKEVIGEVFGPVVPGH